MLTSKGQGVGVRVGVGVAVGRGVVVNVGVGVLVGIDVGVAVGQGVGAGGTTAVQADRARRASTLNTRRPILKSICTLYTRMGLGSGQGGRTAQARRAPSTIGS